jgi:5-methyltetrahydropteroyltriglutamate--homocysteine methyltransferase
VEAFVPGIYPRSEALVQATRDLDRGRATQEAVDAQLRRDLDELVAIQQEADLDLLVDGMLDWQDLFRPLIETSDGIETGALTRFLDTNTFYRAPHVTKDLPRLAEPLPERYFRPLPGPRLVTLPSPFALSVGTGLEPRALAENVLTPALETLSPQLIVLSEPFLARADDPDLAGLADALAVLHGGAPIALWITFGDARKLLARGLADIPVDALGIDFIATSADALPSGFDKHLLAGVIDARSSLLEDPHEIVTFAAELHGRVDRLALVPNGDLQYVSEPIARQKVARLGEARTTSAKEAA